jgi:hypothetical protein
MFKKTWVICFVWPLSSLPAFAFTKEDTLECRVPDGSKFVLKAKYDWNPFAKMTPHASEYSNQEPYKIYYQKKESKKLINTGAQLPHSRDDSQFNYICAHVGLIRGRPVTVYRYLKGNKWVNLDEEAQSKLYLTPVTARQPPQVREHLMRIGAFVELNYAFVAPVQKKIVFEHPLIRDDRVVAVFKSDSMDDGTTWRTPFITNKAEIFEIGRPLHNQSFTGKPIFFNGQKIDALLSNQK